MEQKTQLKKQINRKKMMKMMIDDVMDMEQLKKKKKKGFAVHVFSYGVF